MAADFDNRVALLEERLVRPDAEEVLLRAERLFATGNQASARLALSTAKHMHFLDEFKRERGLREHESDDDV